MIRREELMTLGRYNKPHGVSGEITATLDVDCDELQALSCLVSDMDGIYVPFFVQSCRPRGATTVLLRIDGITTERQAATMTGRDIYALKREYQPMLDADDTDEGYPADYFIGFELRDSAGGHVGTITGVDDATDNVLFLVTTDDDEQLMIPATDDWIVAFNDRDRVITMDLPAGILELNKQDKQQD